MGEQILANVTSSYDYFFVNVIYISFPSELFCGLVIFSFDAERQQTDASVSKKVSVSVDVDASVSGSTYILGRCCLNIIDERDEVLIVYCMRRLARTDFTDFNTQLCNVSGAITSCREQVLQVCQEMI